MRKRISTLIGNEQDGLTVKAVLFDVFALRPREISSLKFIEDGITLNGEKTRVTRTVKAGDLLEIRFPSEQEGNDHLSSYTPVILYEDDDLIIADKPAGIPCHPAHGHLDDDLGTALQSFRHLGTIRAVGRLDKDVSGVIVYAKNRPAAARLSRQRDDGILRKEYTAVVRGKMQEAEGTIRTKIAKKEGSFRRTAGEQGKESVTFYRCEETGDDWSLVRVSLETGRTHQIRAVFSAEGHPLLGDELYGGDCTLIRRPALHCSQVTFRQPFEEREIIIKAGMPADMESLLRCLKEGINPL